MNQMEPKYESLFSSVRFRYQWDEMMVINFRFVFFSSDSFENVCVCIGVCIIIEREKNQWFETREIETQQNRIKFQSNI